jgi:hypothetical protein
MFKKERERMMQTRSFGLFLGVLGLFAFGEARAQTQIKGRVMVLVDTSGSMAFHFTDNVTTGGDGDLQSRYTDGFVTDQSFYPGRLLGGGSFDGINSRLYSAKRALTEVVNSTGNLDFGLMRYALGSTCADARNCCNFASGACICSSEYVDNTFPSNPNGQSCTPSTLGRITWLGGCGPKQLNQAINGGQIVVSPGANSSSTVLRWVDGIEDFRNNGQGSPMNGELRASGPTPVAGSIRTALNQWYMPIRTASTPGCNPAVDPNCDPQIDCRPYVFVLLTDGADSCEGCAQPGGCPPQCTGNPGCTLSTNCPGGNCCITGQCYCESNSNCPGTHRCINNRCYDARQLDAPPTVAQQLYNANPNNPVRTYVIGVAFVPGDPAIDTLNRTAAAGGTGQARIANDSAALQSAFADIVASSVRYESCNNVDDNCNGTVDEGFDRGATCNTGIGACRTTGVQKCNGAGDGTVCCVNDGNLGGACAPLQPGTPAPQEICNNNIDDNCNGIIDEPPPGGCPPVFPETCNNQDDDRDGTIDNNLIDVGQPCGNALGECTQGTTVCTNGTLSCQGGVQPATEICNNRDDNCDGVIDGVSQNCYGGPPGTMDVGICRGGTQRCTSGSFGACLGEVRPGNEVCNTIDDDCNGTVDDAPGTGGSCCPSGQCGVGQCRAGTIQCSGTTTQCVGAIGPTQEICDGIDNDCNGTVDDVPGLGTTCQPPAGSQCPTGTLACDTTQQVVVCQPRSPTNETCDGQDNDCDGSIDEQPDVTQNDSRLGVNCGNQPQSPPPRLPCRLGSTVCRFGQVVCEGEVAPSIEVCDFQDNDCNGRRDDNAPCPAGYECRGGSCITRCGVGEFPCPGGYFCNRDSFCEPSPRCTPACGPGFRCLAAGGGVFACVSNCSGVTCRPYEICNPVNNGNCEDNSCRTKPEKQCPDGEYCAYDNNTDNYLCVQTRCSGVNCNANQYCDPTNGNCLPACVTPCGSTERCVNGQCVNDPCAGTNCSAGQSCDPEIGQCTNDQCDGRVCPTGQACVDGECVTSPCLPVRCPEGTRCLVNPRGGAVNCEAPPPPILDQVVGGGGGGFSCTVSGARTSSGGGAVAMLGVVFLMLWSRRRAAGRRI